MLGGVAKAAHRADPAKATKQAGSRKIAAKKKAPKTLVQLAADKATRYNNEPSLEKAEQLQQDIDSMRHMCAIAGDPS